MPTANCSGYTEQRSSDRSRSIKTIQRQPVAEDVTLAARSAEDRLQSGSADIQSPQHLDAFIPATPNPGSSTGPPHAIDHYDAVNLSRRQHLRNALFGALHQLSGTHYRKLFSLVTVAVFKLRLKTSFPRLSLLPLLTNTLFGPSAPEVTTLWRYTNLSTMNVYI